MMKTHRALGRRLVLLCCLLLPLGLAVALISEAMAVPTATTIGRWVIAGGGGHADAHPYDLDGTIGQAVTGTAGDFPRRLCSGFWCGEGRSFGENVFLPVVVRNH